MELLHEPQGAEYRVLVKFLAERAATFSLVWRSDCAYATTAELIRRRLAPFLVRTEGTSTWPGTEYFGGLAVVRHYRTVPEAINILGDVPRLFAWQGPDLPEDLAFYTDDGGESLGLSPMNATHGSSWTACQMPVATRFALWTMRMSPYLALRQSLFARSARRTQKSSSLICRGRAA